MAGLELSHADIFPIGCTVEAHSLSSVELNGLRGKVIRYDDDRVVVRFEGKGLKALQPKNMKRLEAGSQAQLLDEMERRKQQKYKVGDKIEIFSNTNQHWCKGEVMEVERRHATCTYITAAGATMSKNLAMGHPNLRFDNCVLPHRTNGANHDKKLLSTQTEPHLDKEAEQQPATAIAEHAPMDVRRKARALLSKASRDGSLAAAVQGHSQQKDDALRAATSSSSSSAPAAPIASTTAIGGDHVNGQEGAAEPQTQNLSGRPRVPTELDTVTVQHCNYPRVSIAASIPGIAIKTLGVTAALAGVGIGYSVGKLLDFNGDGVANSTAFVKGCEAGLYANGIFPHVLCEHDDEGRTVGPLPTGEEKLNALWRGVPLMVANHSSYLDVLVLSTICKMPKFMSMAEVNHWPVFGRLGQDLDYIWVDRKSPDARKQALEAVQTHVDSWKVGDRPLLVFPEGTTSNGEGLHPFKKGAFITGAPLRPVILKYTGNWNPANVLQVMEEQAAEGTSASTSSDPRPYGDGEWALQYAAHLTHGCVVLVCRTYYPSKEEQADSGLYAENVRKYMLKRIEEPVPLSLMRLQR